jgi:hypothetical protein
VTNLRWRTVHLQNSVKDLLTAALTDLGWIADPIPSYITSPVSIEEDWDAEMALAGQGPNNPNTVGISTGDLGDSIPYELGSNFGGLMAYRYPVFMDVYGESRAVATRLSDDIRDVLLGELFTATRFLPIYDHSTSPATLVVDQPVEQCNVEARWPSGVGEQDWKRAWRVVAMTAVWYFNGNSLDAIAP